MDKVKPSKNMDTNPFKATALSSGVVVSSKKLNLDDIIKTNFRNITPNLQKNMKSKKLCKEEESSDEEWLDCEGSSDCESLITHANDGCTSKPNSNDKSKENYEKTLNNIPKLKPKIFQHLYKRKLSFWNQRLILTSIIF